MLKKIIRRIAILIECFWIKAYKYPRIARIITNRFHGLYYYTRKKTWQNTFWLGTPLLKCPLDLWTYQEIIFELKPDVIIECGTNQGGGALFFSSVCDLVSKGRILSIDIEENEKRPKHERITYLVGSSTSDAIVKKVRDFISEGEKVMVVLDSDHSMEHVLKEMRIYSEFVTLGSYLIIEDSNVNGHPVFYKHGPGPMEALKVFLSENEAFEIDKTREEFHLSFNPNGYLKRIKNDIKGDPKEYYRTT